VKAAAVSAALLALGATAFADDHVEPTRERDWTIGVELSWFSHPQGHLGAPLGDFSHLAPAAYGRRHFTGDLSWTFGAGLPSAQGLSAWGGLELRHVLWSSCARCNALEVYGGVDVQLGFVGPDYYQRHDNEFVGYTYAASGPIGLGGRVDAGVRLRWLADRFETSLQAVEVVARPMASNISAGDHILSFQVALGVRL
jgi:hypothetical protein